MPSCILAIDTTTIHGQVAVVDMQGEVRYQHEFSAHRSHNSQLFVPLRQALVDAGNDLSLIVVGSGPGSYTGARIGIAAAQALAWSRGAQVITLPSLLAIQAETTPGIPYYFCGDARRGQFYLAQVLDSQLQSPIQTVSAEGLSIAMTEHPTVPWYTFDARAPLGNATVQSTRPSAVGLAGAAARLSSTDITDLSQEATQPIYLSSPFVTVGK